MSKTMKLDPRFEKEFDRLRDTYGKQLAALNGFADEQLNYTDFIDQFVDKQTVADATIDGNANVGHKDIVSLENEMSKPHSKLLAFSKIYYELCKKYGEGVAKDWLENEWDGHFYLHDAYNTSFKSYCFAYDLEQIVNRGLFFVENFNSQPPKHLTTFTDFVGEFVSFACNRSSGAVGLPSFLIYSFYFWHKDCKENYVLKDPAYYRDQSFQEIIYKLNQPYLRSGIQSAFTNFSIFDRPYLEALFGGKTYPDGSFVVDYIDEILEYEKAFMQVVSEVRAQNMMTFPVLTFALLRQDGKFVDEEFAKWCCAHNMRWGDSNFFISDDVTSLSNCCLDGDEVVAYCAGDGPRFHKIRDVFLKYAGMAVAVPYHQEWRLARPVCTAYHGDMYCIYAAGTRVRVTGNHLVPTQRGDVRADELTLDDSVEMDDRRFEPIGRIDREKNRSKIVYCFEMIDQDVPYFTLPNGMVTHNCRLKSNIKDLGYFNSIGGTALEVGSVKVNTINLARIAYESATTEEYLNTLSAKTVLCLKVLDQVRHIIARNVEKGLLPNYSLGLMHMDKQYNTIGIIGIYEALEKFGMTYKDELGNTYYSDEGIEFAKQILRTITENKNEFAKSCDYMINIEQIPGERAASVLMQKDKFFFPNEAYDLPLYGNQWIPLGVQTTMHEKIRLSAIMDEACSGGSIMHVNLDAPIEDFDTAWSLLNYIADAGVQYFAFNLRISACKHNHGFYGKTCPICGEPVETTYQRIVGFLVPTKTYSKERKAEFSMRTWFDVLGDDLT